VVGIIMPLRNNPEPNPVAHDDLIHLAQALDGIAGCLHECKAVEREDLDAACQAAKELWVRDHDVQDQEFEAARSDLHRWAASAATGEPRAASFAERSAHRLAGALRMRAHVHSEAVASKPKDGALDARAAIRKLDRRYARFALNPVPLPM
jgi:hypothetical protein